MTRLMVTLNIAAKREWIKVEATGQRPKATNYVQMTTMGSKLIILSHLTMPYIYFFDTSTCLP
jgi:hypothetical protein